MRRVIVSCVVRWFKQLCFSFLNAFKYFYYNLGLRLPIEGIEMWSRSRREFSFESTTWDNPVYLSFLMEQRNLSHQIYNAMRSDDLSEAVVVASKCLKDTNKMPQYSWTIKCEEKSDMYRTRGNEALQRKEYQKTLKCFNRALLFAPTGSLAMKLAYSNKSALLFSVKLFTATLKDIDTVFTLGCPEDLVERLRKRKAECTAKLQTEAKAEKNFYAKDDFFRFNVERNLEIPCASSHVGVTLESGVPQIVALKHIEVGQLVAVEEAFLSEIGDNNRLSACHYCLKFHLNMIPCDMCCFALFCGNECKTKCNEEYHDIECQIIEFLTHVLRDDDYFGISVKAAIKIWKLSKDWSKVISASEEMGRKMSRKSSTIGMFDSKSPFSLLNFDDEKHLDYGVLYNYSWYCAVLLHLLSKVPNFWPKADDQKQNAFRAMARLILGLRLFEPQIQTREASVVMKDAYNKGGDYSVGVHRVVNMGYFSFAGKLKHKCHANLMTVGLTNKIALVAIKPIKRGEELTISFLFDLDMIYNICSSIKNRKVVLYKRYYVLCSCHLCIPFNYNRPMSEAAKACMMKLKLRVIHKDTSTAKGSKRHFKSLCDALTVFSDVPYVPPHDILFGLFIKCLHQFQVSKTRNTTMEI